MDWVSQHPLDLVMPMNTPAPNTHNMYMKQQQPEHIQMPSFNECEYKPFSVPQQQQQMPTQGQVKSLSSYCLKSYFAPSARSRIVFAKHVCLFIVLQVTSFAHARTQSLLILCFSLTHSCTLHTYSTSLLPVSPFRTPSSQITV